jgi:NTP pyrophosphohydrolases including oxidative damage repair enzymes
LSGIICQVMFLLRHGSSMKMVAKFCSCTIENSANGCSRAAMPMGLQICLRFARREALEETGLPGHCLQCLSPKIFDVHVHQVAAVKGAPHHQHFDIRYLFRASSNTTPPGNHESFSLAWVPIHDVKLYQNSHGHRRLVAKTRQALFKP